VYERCCNDTTSVAVIMCVLHYQFIVAAVYALLSANWRALARFSHVTYAIATTVHQSVVVRTAVKEQ
jgi:uncharacterized membrane protein YwzB